MGLRCCSGSSLEETDAMDTSYGQGGQDANKDGKVPEPQAEAGPGGTQPHQTKTQDPAPKKEAKIQK